MNHPLMNITFKAGAGAGAGAGAKMIRISAASATQHNSFASDF
jgi:hypothetical protein